jgi:hypothetical protein
MQAFRTLRGHSVDLRWDSGEIGRGATGALDSYTKTGDAAQGKPISAASVVGMWMPAGETGQLLQGDRSRKKLRPGAIGSVKEFANDPGTIRFVLIAVHPEAGKLVARKATKLEKDSGHDKTTLVPALEMMRGGLGAYTNRTSSNWKNPGPVKVSGIVASKLILTPRPA